MAVIGSPAPYGRRLVAVLLDWSIHAAGSVVGTLIGIAFLFGDEIRPLGLIVIVLTLVWAVGFGVFNNIIRQGQSGQTWGKRQQGIKLVSTGTGNPPGIGPAFLRWLIFVGFSLVTGGLYAIADYLAPAFGERKLRITDRLLSLEVIEGGFGSTVGTGKESAALDDLSDPY